MHRPHRPRSIAQTAPPALLALAVLLYAAWFSFLTIQRYHAYEARALDMGNLHQAIWNTAHGDWFRMTNQEEGLTSRLSMHVEPILLPIAGIYRLLPGVETLLVLQALVVALGAVPLFALARRRGLGEWAALAFAVAWLLNPTIQAANWLEFHPVTLAPTFLLAAFYFLVAGNGDKNRTGTRSGEEDVRRNIQVSPAGPRAPTIWFVVFAVLAAACKEEIGLLVAMMGLYAAVFQRRWRLGLVTFALGAGWSLLAVLGIQAAFAGGNIHWGRYAWLGESTGAKLLTLVTRPDLLAAQLGAAGVGRYFFELLLPVGFLSLLAPEVLLLALPSLAINLLADFSPMHQVTTLIYAAPVVPFVLLSAVMGSTRLLRWVAARRSSPPIEIGGYEDAKPVENRLADDQHGHVGVPTDPHVGVRATQSTSHARSKITSSPRHPLTRSPAHPLMRLALPLYVLAFALLSQRLYGYLPGSGNALALETTAHHQAAQAIIDRIPSDAAVSAQDRLNPHVAGRRTVYIFPRVAGPDTDADTVFLDVTGSAWPQHPNDLRRSVDDLLQNGFGVAAAADGYLLLRKGDPSRTIDGAFYTAWDAADQPLPGSVAVGAQFGDSAGAALRLEDARVRSDRYGELVVDMTWTAPQTLTEDLRFYVALLDPEGNVLHDTVYYQPVSVLWYPTSLWPAGQRIHVETLPWQVYADQVVVAVGVFAGEEGWTSGGRLPVTNAAGLPLLEDGTLLRLGGFGRTAAGDWAALPPLPPAYADLPAHSLDLRFGEALRMDSAALPAEVKAGASLPVALTWQRDGDAPPNLSRFVHLLDSAGNKAAQADGQITDAFGPLPMTGWPQGTPVYDLVTLAVPADLPPGEYTMAAGLYDWQTGERLPAAGADARDDGSAVIGSVRIEP